MTMEKLRAEMTAFFQKLYIDQQKVLVFGEGPLHARLMLIGEAPGEQESLQGRPFVGKAGRNLDEFLALSGLATGASWLCYYRALQLGQVAKVVTVDKFSLVLTILLGALLLGEKLNVKTVLGALLVTVGTLVIAFA